MTKQVPTKNIQILQENTTEIIEKTIIGIKDSIQCINNLFEIRLNFHKKQDLFNNNILMNNTKKMISYLTSIDIILYPILLENTNTIVYIYNYHNKFYHFHKGHYNFRLINTKYYTCRINELGENKFIVECKLYEEPNVIISININDFIDMIENVYMYEEQFLNIFL